MNKLINSTIRNEYELSDRFLQMALANVLSNIVFPLTNTICVFFLGHLSEIQHLAGVTLTGSLFGCIYEALVFVRAGTTGLTAQAVGRNDREEILLVALRNGLIALMLGIALILLQHPIREIALTLLDLTPEVKASLIACFNAQIWAAPGVLLNFVLVASLLGQEKSQMVLLLSIIGSIANVLIDYLFIVRLNMSSAGAGISLVINEYLTLSMVLIVFCRDVQWQELRMVAERIFNTAAMKSTFILNGNIFISRFAALFTFLTFNYEGVALGTIIYTENALLLQIVLLLYSSFQGIQFAVETMSGNFKETGTNDDSINLIGLAVRVSLLLAISIAGVCVLFPMSVFGLLTSHNEIIEKINIYVPWLILVLGFGAVNFMFIGYYLGLAEGHTIRNSALISIVVFLPTAIAALWFHNNHILWLAMSVFPAIGVLFLGIRLLITFKNDITVGSVLMLAIPIFLYKNKETGLFRNWYVKLSR